MNWLKLIASSRVWNFVEKVQTRTPTTTRTIQNSMFLRVEFTLRASQRLETQDYHGLRGRSDAKGLAQRVPRHPDNPAIRGGHNGHRMTFGARHFPVDEQVLYLLSAGKAQRLQGISGLPRPDEQTR